MTGRNDTAILKQMPSDYEALRAERQRLLIEFLRNELRIGPTLVEAAALIAKNGGNNYDYAEAKERAENAAKTVRTFVDEIEDHRVKGEVRKGLAELYLLIAAL